MKRNLINTVLALIIIFNIGSATILATNGGEVEKDFWGQTSTWSWKAFIENSDKLGNNQGIGNIIATFEDMVLVVGTAVISIATIFLGIKFMYGSAEAKADTKEGLINLLVACLFFFGWNSIKNLLFPNNGLIFLNPFDTDYTNPIGRIYSVFVYIAQIAAVVAIIYVGLKYIFAGVQGKTELKAKSGMFLVGIILAFCSTGFLTYISKVINEALAK